MKDIINKINFTKDLVNILKDYTIFMDNFFKNEENRNFYADVYVEYKKFSDNVYLLSKEYGFIKEK